MEKQLLRMRKKEENPVNRKTIAKRNTNPLGSGGNGLGESAEQTG